MVNSHVHVCLHRDFTAIKARDGRQVIDKTLISNSRSLILVPCLTSERYVDVPVFHPTMYVLVGPPQGPVDDGVLRPRVPKYVLRYPLGMNGVLPRLSREFTFVFGAAHVGNLVIKPTPPSKNLAFAISARLASTRLAHLFVNYSKQASRKVKRPSSSFRPFRPSTESSLPNGRPYRQGMRQ